MTTEHIRYLLENRLIILENIVMAAKYIPETDDEILEAICMRAQELKPDKIQTQSSEKILETIAQKDKEMKEGRTVAWELASQKAEIERLDAIVFGLKAIPMRVLLLRFYERKSLTESAQTCNYSDDNITLITSKAIRDIKERWEEWEKR